LDNGASFESSRNLFIMTKTKTYDFFLLFQLVLLLQHGLGFLIKPRDHSHRHLSGSVHENHNARPRRCLHQAASSSDRGDGEDGMDSMRSMLEASWSVESMGYVPSDPASAAEAAVTALNQAMMDRAMKRDDKNVKAYFIDLSFPPYDISQGTGMYDEVSAVEFCMELAQKMAAASSVNGKSLILVRDDKTVEIVNRILTARQENPETNQPDTTMSTLQNQQLQAEEEDDDDEEDEEDDVEVECTEPPVNMDDVDAFRQKLMADWDTSSIDLKTQQKSSDDRPPTPVMKRPNEGSPSSASLSRWSRLASMFGGATISPRGGMATDVAKAIQRNVQLQENENTLILLSLQNTREELMALRRIMQLASTDGGESPRAVVLVNCKLEQPLPRELGGAQTVYSLLPLVAKQAEAGRTPFQNDPRQQQQAKAAPVKIVVMRRFPRDWEVFVDDGTGSSFELAATVPMGLETKRGPLMEWVSGAVMRFLQGRPR